MSQSTSDNLTASQVSEICDDVDIYEMCERFERDELDCSLYDGELIDVCAGVESTFIKSTSNDGSDINSLAEEQKESVTQMAKRPKTEEPSTSILRPHINLKVDCSICKITTNESHYEKHLKSNLHKHNVLKARKSLTNMTIVESAFGHKLMTYNINNHSEENETPDEFLASVKSYIRILVNDNVELHTVFKASFVLLADFVREEEITTFDLQTNNFVVFKGDDFERFFSNVRNNLVNKICSFERRSGRSLMHIKSIDMNVNKFYPIYRNFYVD